MLKVIKPEAILDNPFKLIGKDQMLITACTKKVSDDGNIITGRPNTMTANWGGLGVLWNKNVATVYIRPSRYTKEIIDETDTFSLSFLPERYKTALDYCGCHSGRNEDKFRATKLDVEYMNGTPWIKQARLVLFCQKLYSQELDSFKFVEEKVCNQFYRKNDFHTIYIGEITKVLAESRDLK
ncbi:flavin reductase [uncultured Treponema sp.]|uniref:flavin reductase family protein n=1 Tax=uncultured Treponema sp. TaxID=162155 RepID=UPI0028040A93|nr:flavin reductase [uncultured Treponema sp.]